MPTVPASVSDHPATWTFGFPIHHVETRAALRAWLQADHDTERGLWLASWRPVTGRPAVAYPEVVEEAICFGWIDSTVNLLDDERALQLLTPRRAKSTWTRLNRARAARMEAEGRMTPAGRRAIEVAQGNGWWTILDPVEDLLEPDDLAAALDAVPAARSAWDRFPPSARKPLLLGVVTAVRPDTRARRIARIVSEAAAGRRAAG